jgi:hypothetical protein
MRAKTEMERRLCEYANLLPPLADEIQEWAFANLFKPEAYYWQHRGKKQEIWCQSCGHREPCDGWLIMGVSGEWTCPECGKTCRVRRYKTETNALNVAKWMSVIDVRNGLQVVRTFEVCKDNSGKGQTQYYVREMYQNWMPEKGTEVITSRPYARNFSQAITWGIGPYEIKRHGGYYTDIFAVEDNYLYPKAKVAGYIRRKGMDARMVKKFAQMRIPFPSCLGKWMKVPYYETLWKTQEMALFKYFMAGNYRRKLEDYKDSIRIARRRGWEFKEVGLWLDYVDELRQLGMDDRSPKYLCPQDLRAAHAATSRRLNAIRDLEKVKAEKQRIAGYEADYARHIASFLGLCFTAGDIEIRPLPTVMSVYEEGEAMHHCIYRMNYWKQQDTLLMSARGKEGVRLESIEIDLREFKVAQSRGLQNQPSAEHKAIVALVNKNMNQIKRIRKAI